MDDPDLIELTMRVAQATAKPSDEGESVANPASGTGSEQPREIEAQPAHPNIGTLVANPQEMKTPEELAAMIRADLSKIEGCPNTGLKVTCTGPIHRILGYRLA